MAKMKLVPSYRFDKYGYFIGATVSMQDLTTGRMYLPGDCVAFAPPEGSGCWRITQDKSAWECVPAVSELDARELVVGLEDVTERGAQIKARMLEEERKGKMVRCIDRDNRACYLTPLKGKARGASPLGELERRRAYALALGL